MDEPLVFSEETAQTKTNSSINNCVHEDRTTLRGSKIFSLDAHKRILPLGAVQGDAAELTEREQKICAKEVDFFAAEHVSDEEHRWKCVDGTNSTALMSGQKVLVLVGQICKSLSFSSLYEFSNCSILGRILQLESCLASVNQARFANRKAMSEKIEKIRHELKRERDERIAENIKFDEKKRLLLHEISKAKKETEKEASAMLLEISKLKRNGLEQLSRSHIGNTNEVKVSESKVSLPMEPTEVKGVVGIRLSSTNYDGQGPDNSLCSLGTR